MREKFKLHAMPSVTILDWDVKLTSTFWKALFTRLGSTYHPQTDGKIEQVN